MRLLLHPMAMSCLKLPYQARVPVIRGLTRFLTMAEVALVQDGQDGEVTIDCVIFKTKLVSSTLRTLAVKLVYSPTRFV